MEKLNIGLGCSGGTAAPMAATCKYIVEKFSSLYNIWALPECWRLLTGISNEKCHLLTPDLVQDWDEIGGSPFLPSCKNTNIFRIPTGINQVTDYSGRVRDFYAEHDLHGIILIGGGGTILQTAELLRSYPDLNINVLLATMDNDVSLFDNSLGFATAVQTNAENIVASVSDGKTMLRPTLAFTMGYATGRVAFGSAAMANEKLQRHGINIDFVYLPESHMGIDDFAEYLKENYRGKGRFFGVCSEGVCSSTDGSDGHHKTFDIPSFCKQVAEKSGIDGIKVVTGDYRQRAGIPSTADLALANSYATQALDLVSSKEWGKVIGGTLANYVPIDYAARSIKNQGDGWNTWFRGKNRPKFTSVL